MHYTKISPEFECQGERSRSRSPGTKKRKSAAFCSGAVLGGAVLYTPVGKSAHAVYSVSITIRTDLSEEL